MNAIRTFATALAFAGLAISNTVAEPTTTIADTSRVVAIGGSITEIVYALGEQGKLVARDSTSVYPPEAIKLPDVGYMRQLSPEGVLSVNPSGIIALHGSGPKEAVEVLRKASVPYVEVPETYDRQGILTKIRAVGAALNLNDKAEALAKDVDAKLVAAEAATSKVSERKRVLFVLSLQGGKIMAAGDDTAAGGIIKMAGAVNAVDGFAGYKPLSDEAVIGAKPDVVLMMDRGGGSHAITEDQVFGLPAIASTPAGANRKLVKMDGAYLLGFGPRTADAIRELATAIYGNEISN